MPVTYQTLLEEARQLSPEDLHRLRVALGAIEQNTVNQPRPNVQEAAHEAIARLDELAARISAAWQDDMSAVDAVKEQRRDL